MKKGGDVSGAISTASLLTNIRIAQGKYRAAARLCQQACLLGQGYSLAPQGLADIHVTQAWLAVGELDLDKAEALLAQANELGEHARLPESAHHWYIVQAQIETIRGQFEAAADLIGEAQDVSNPGPVPDFAPLVARQARLDIV